MSVCVPFLLSYFIPFLWSFLPSSLPPFLLGSFPSVSVIGFDLCPGQFVHTLLNTCCVGCVELICDRPGSRRVFRVNPLPKLRQEKTQLHNGAGPNDRDRLNTVKSSVCCVIEEESIPFKCDQLRGCVCVFVRERKRESYTSGVSGWETGAKWPLLARKRDMSGPQL